MWESPAEQTLPAGWLSRWNRPPAEDRPLQIVHGIPAGRGTPEGMRYYKDRGLGGLVLEENPEFEATVLAYDRSRYDRLNSHECGYSSPAMFGVTRGDYSAH